MQDRLWAHRVETIHEQHLVERPALEQQAPWIKEVHDIDSQIAHAQQVLRDLATSRMEISVEKSRLAGTETPDSEAVFSRHRQAIRIIESQALRLQNIRTDLMQSTNSGACRCGEFSGTVSSVLDSIRTQLYLICQELGRQQSAHTQLLLHSQRDGVDRCELELTRQIQRLRLRRDEILHHQDRTAAETLQHRTRQELAFCDCEEHSNYLRKLPPSTCPASPTQELVTRSRDVVHSLARPEDAEREVQLSSRIRQLRKQWWEAQTKWRDAHQQLARLEQEQTLFASDTTLQERRYEYVIIEQQLADAREQWQSLAMLQYVLQATFEKSRIDRRSPVIDEASRLLSRLTEGRYVGFQFIPDHRELKVISESGSQLDILTLSRGTLDQACLSFRLALCSEYKRRGINFPIILDDVLADSDERRLKISIEVLQEYALAGTQIIFFTCQDRLVAMFEDRQVPVQSLSGSSQRRLPSVTVTNSLPGNSEITPLKRLIDREPVVTTPHILRQEEEARRVQPASPFWLELNSSLSYLPSMSAQMARRLGSLGVKDIGELLDLNPDSTELPLHALQISREQLRIWQGEGSLLCCVPDLTGRDAQLLVKAGYDQPQKLAQAETDLLLSRLNDAWQQQTREAEQQGLLEHSGRPDREIATRWTRSARRGRTLAQARDWTHRRQPSGMNERRRRRREQRRQEFMDGRNTLHRRTDGTTFLTTRQSAVRSQQKVPNPAETLTITSPGRRHFLQTTSDLVDAPSIGPKTASRFHNIGIHLVSDFLNTDPADLAEKLQSRHITTSTIRTWQKQSALMCRVPELRGHDVQLLVACGLETPEQITSLSPQRLLEIVGPFATTKEGQRLLRSATAPDLDEVSHWIVCANHARNL